MKHLDVQLRIIEAICREGENSGKTFFFWTVFVSVPEVNRSETIEGVTPYPSFNEALEGLLCEMDTADQIPIEIRAEIKLTAQRALVDTEQSGITNWETSVQ